MRFFHTSILLCLWQTCLPAIGRAQLPLSESQQKFRGEFAASFQALEKKNAAAMTGADGWLFLSSELRLLSVDRFWGEAAAKVGRATKPELADPIPAIVDFHRQLKARGIHLLLVPVPPKAAIYPEKVLPGTSHHGGGAAPVLAAFYDELRKRDIDVLDLTRLFLENSKHERGAVFCKTDTHWSGVGCMLAAQAIAEKVRAKFPAESPKTYAPEWRETAIAGDFAALLPKDAPKPKPENIWVRSVSEKTTGAGVEADPNSPLLLLGDSHTLVFHDFLAKKSGLLDLLALELGQAPDLIGIRGSGATPVRLNLLRQSVKDPGYLAKKKVVIWCFTAREFIEAEGWSKLPVAK